MRESISPVLNSATEVVKAMTQTVAACRDDKADEAQKGLDAIDAALPGFLQAIRDHFPDGNIRAPGGSDV